MFFIGGKLCKVVIFYIITFEVYYTCSLKFKAVPRYYYLFTFGDWCEMAIFCAFISQSWPSDHRFVYRTQQNQFLLNWDPYCGFKFLSAVPAMQSYIYIYIL